MKAAARIVRALRHRNFRLYIGGQLVSLVGTWLQVVAQSWLVYRLTDSPLLLGATGFVGQAPVFFLAPLAARWRTGWTGVAFCCSRSRRRPCSPESSGCSPSPAT